MSLVAQVQWAAWNPTRCFEVNIFFDDGSAAHEKRRVPECENNHTTVIKCCVMCLLKIPGDIIWHFSAGGGIYIYIYKSMSTWSILNWKTHSLLMQSICLNNRALHLWCGVRFLFWLLRWCCLALCYCTALFGLKTPAKVYHNAGLWATSNSANGNLLIVFSNRKWQLNSVRQCRRPWWIIGGFSSEWACVGVRQCGLAVLIYKRSN